MKRVNSNRCFPVWQNFNTYEITFLPIYQLQNEIRLTLWYVCTIGIVHTVLLCAALKLGWERKCCNPEVMTSHSQKEMLMSDFIQCKGCIYGHAYIVLYMRSRCTSTMAGKSTKSNMEVDCKKFMMKNTYERNTKWEWLSFLPRFDFFNLLFLLFL